VSGRAHTHQGRGTTLCPFLSLPFLFLSLIGVKMQLRGWIVLVFLLFGGCNSTTREDDDDKKDAAALPSTCIENWPVDPKATPSPSLPVDNAGQVLWTKEVPGGTYVGPLAMAGERLAYVSGNTLHILDRAGNLVSSFMEPTSFTGASGPVADTEGNFYFGNAEITSVTPDGEGRWHQTLGVDISGSTETTYTSQLTLSPDGILYFTATDGFLYAFNASDGELTWKREVGISKYGPDPFRIGHGIGDTIITEGGHYNAISGAVSALPTVDGIEYGIGRASYSSLLGFTMNAETNWWKIRGLNPCGEPKYSLPADKYNIVELVGFDDSMIGIYGENAIIYSAIGEEQVGPVPLNGHYRPQVIGADGTIYYRYCTEDVYDVGEMSIQAYSPSLELLWSVEVGSPCTLGPFGLAEDGVLYVLRTVYNTPNVHLELTAIQTASPGLANTAYPTFRTTNRRTGWIGGPL